MASFYGGVLAERIASFYGGVLAARIASFYGGVLAERMASFYGSVLAARIASFYGGVLAARMASFYGGVLAVCWRCVGGVLAVCCWRIRGSPLGSCFPLWQFVGDMGISSGILLNQPATAVGHVETTAPTTCLVWSRAQLHDMCRRSPPIAAVVQAAVQADVVRNLASGDCDTDRELVHRLWTSRYASILGSILVAGSVDARTRLKLLHYRRSHGVTAGEHEASLASHGWSAAEFEAGRMSPDGQGGRLAHGQVRGQLTHPAVPHPTTRAASPRPNPAPSTPTHLTPLCSAPTPNPPSSRPAPPHPIPPRRTPTPPPNPQLKGQHAIKRPDADTLHKEGPLTLWDHRTVRAWHGTRWSYVCDCVAWHAVVICV